MISRNKLLISRAPTSRLTKMTKWPHVKSSEEQVSGVKGEVEKLDDQ